MIWYKKSHEKNFLEFLLTFTEYEKKVFKKGNLNQIDM